MQPSFPDAYAAPRAHLPPPRGVSVIEAIRFAFSGPSWTSNLLLGTVLMIIPLVGPFAMHGWMAEGHQRLARGHSDPLPKFEFSDFTHYLERGVGPFVVQLVLLMPALLLTYGLIAVAVVAAVLLAPTQPALGLLVAAAASLCGAGVGITGSLVSNAAMTRVERTENVGESLSPSRAFGYLGKTWKTTLVSTLLFSLCAVGMAMAGMVFCFIGMYPMIVAIQIASMHLRFQIHEEGVANGGESIPLKDPKPLPSEMRGQMGYGYGAAWGQPPPWNAQQGAPPPYNNPPQQGAPPPWNGPPQGGPPPWNGPR